MAKATVGGLEVNYEVAGSGPPILMMAPGGFESTIEKWSTAGVWKGMRPLQTLAKDFTLIAYDRRETGASGGRVEALNWGLYADQAKGLLDHLGFPQAIILGGCMGCCVALAFAARHPSATAALVLHWPVGGYRYHVGGADRFARHRHFAREKGLDAVIERARSGLSFARDPEAGPWAAVLARDPQFAASFAALDPDRYLGIIAASGRALFDRHTAPGAEAEEMLGMKMPALIIPGDDPSHATSAAHYLRELLPGQEFWPVMPPDQTPDAVRDRILSFARAAG